MKFTIAILCAAAGYVAFDPSARAVVMSQPSWLMIVTGSIAGSIVYVLIGFFNAIETIARFKTSKCSSSDDGFFGFIAGVFWPVHWLVFKPVNWLICNPIDRLLKIADERIDNRINKLRNKDTS